MTDLFSRDDGEAGRSGRFDVHDDGEVNLAAASTVAVHLFAASHGIYRSSARSLPLQQRC